ncbi:cilia- and flagella-associated protein 206-like [Salvelinus namaycush]|uniref:Cilia- and flagella-associated protein 206 n=1 Tax=Salvelinus namaycush TaxID=8040 RepID=A0A8U0TK21_SALNM|nr:cilia- and flagella-associated protein 206-like [Salvelinus namaycush]
MGTSSSVLFFTVQREFLEDHQRVLQSKLGPVSREIPDSRVKTREDLEGLYHKIVSNVLLSSGLVSPTDITTMREATDPFHSSSKLEDILVPEIKNDEKKMKESSAVSTVIQYTREGWAFTARSDYVFSCNPSIGVLKHREKYYVFSSKETALRFGSKPDEYIARVAEKAKRSPELIQLLQLPVSLHILRGETVGNSSTQVDTYLLETNIVNSYEWNEWELRRKAIKLANNLHSKVARSMQAHLIHMRRDNVTQTYLPDDGVCQCKRDGKSNVPKPQMFLAGLLGGKTNTTHIFFF